MNKRITGIIIGLMSVALLGLVALQTRLVLATIEANEEAFDKNVQNALSTTAQQLENLAEERDMLLVANGYSDEFLNIPGVNPGNVAPENGAFSEVVPLDNHVDAKAAARFLNMQNIQLCDECQQRQQRALSRYTNYSLINTHSPLEERIEVERLKKILDQELKNNGIETRLEYAVYSNTKANYVIYNDKRYLKGEYPASLPNMDESTYRVPLFDSEDYGTPGELRVFFPEKQNLLWRSLLPGFLGTFFFAAIILASFGYTLWVINHQKRLSEMKNDFINNMTHEFKTPIATISLAADSITNPKISGDPSKVARFANIIKQENKRMNSQVEKVLQMAKIDRRDIKLRLSEVDLHDVIHQAVENIGLQLEQRNGQIATILEATNPVIEADLTHVSSIINNLLDNANKYSPEAPVITVRTRSLPNALEITVADKGIGMSKEARKHIFDKFYRVHTGDIHNVKGFGLGLAYVKAMMDAHKGSVDVKSEPGQGSEFILTFPVSR